jgi:hypothetical protein
MKSFVGKILKSFIEDAVREISLEPYDGYTQESRQVLPPGVDANPIADDQAVGFTLDDSDGKDACVGIISDSPEVDNGEIKVYSRDSGGALQSQVYCKKDGLIVIKNQLHDMKTLGGDLITELKALKTLGSPTNHTVDPSSQALLDAWLVKWEALFGDN